MRHIKRLWLFSVVLLLAGILVMLLAGCDLASPQPTPLPGVPTAPPPLLQPSPVPSDTVATAPSVITLTLWTTEALSPTQVITSGQILARQAADFQKTYPDVRLRFVVKKAYGKGGILDYLLTTEAVVPELLPDLVFIDVNELGTAVQAGVIQPLDDLLPAALAADLYPFAREACTFDRQLYGLQFQADLDHLAYNTGQMTVPPSSWPGVLSNPGPYLFPAGGQAGLVNDAFMIQYLAVRPWPSSIDPDEPFLEQESLAVVLQFYQDGLSRGVFPGDILEYHTTDECWRAYIEGRAAISQVSAHRYLSERDRAPRTAVTSIPAISGPAAAIGRGWVLALVAADPIRQSAAVEFMLQWLSPGTNAAWNLAAGYLPTRQAALAEWDEQDIYVALARQQLEVARPRPAVPQYTRVAAALQKAVESVVMGVATPEEAAAQAVADTQ